MLRAVVSRVSLIASSAAVVVGLAIGAGPAGATSVPPPADAGALTWAVVPATSAGPDGRVSLRHVLDPGAVAEDAIAIQNLGTQAAEFTVLAGDGVVGDDGAFDIAEAAVAGSWISVGGLTESTVQVAAGETTVLPVTITVPQNATPGDHPAGIVVGQSSATGGSVLTHRVGVRVHLQVSGDLAPVLATKVVSTDYRASANPLAPGTLTITYTVTNPGNTRYAAEPSVTVAGPGGLGRKTLTGEPIELLPAATRTATVSISAWPLGVASGELTAAPLQMGEDSAPLPAQASAGFRLMALSWTVLAAVVLLLTGVGIAIARGIRYRQR